MSRAAGMSPLERRCKILLLTYPAWYRRERGAEILTTLLDANPTDAAWPSARDAISLLMGGLKIRTGQNRRLGMPASIRTAVLLASCFRSNRPSPRSPRRSGRQR